VKSGHIEFKEVGRINDNVRILKIGAGVNASICAVGLHNAGADVTVLASGKHFKELCDIIYDTAMFLENLLF